MAKRQQGYNIALKVGDKTFIGRTQEDFNLTQKINESLTKEDQGNTQREVVGYDFTFAVSGLMTLKEAGDEAERMDSDDIMTLALQKGSESVIDFRYDRGGLKAYQGKAIITSYSESTNAEDVGTYTINLQNTGALTAVAAG